MEKLNVFVSVKGWEDSYKMIYDGVNLKLYSLDRIMKRAHPKTKEIVNYQMKGKLIKPYLGNVGYYTLTLSRYNVDLRMLTHRLIALHYMEQKPGHDCINHKDGNKLNNAIDNLEWVTKKQNNMHGLRTGLLKRKLTNENILEIKQMISAGFMKKDIASKFNISTTLLRKIDKRDMEFYEYKF